MSFVVAAGCEIMATWEERTRVTLAWARSAMSAWVFGGIVLSWVASRYQDGMVCQAAGQAALRTRPRRAVVGWPTAVRCSRGEVGGEGLAEDFGAQVEVDAGSAVGQWVRASFEGVLGDEAARVQLGQETQGFTFVGHERRDVDQRLDVVAPAAAPLMTAPP